MTKRIIAIDVDDVIANSTESLRILVNESYGVNLTAEDYNMEASDYWGYYERVWQKHGIDNVDYDSLPAKMAEDQSHVPLMLGVSFALGELSNKFDIAIVTARNLEWEKATLEWLSQHFGDSFIGVHFVGRDSVKTKGELCKEIGAFLLVDDNIEHCRSATEVGLEAILFGDYGWNKNRDGVHRCKDWTTTLEYINGKYR